VLICAALMAAFCASAGNAEGAPRPKSFVIVDPELAVNGPKAQVQIDALMRRFESVLGWKIGTLEGRGFLSIKDAEPFLKKQQPIFGLLPAHEFVSLRRSHRLEVMGFAGVWDLKKCSFKGLALKTGNVSALPHQQEGLRLATTITDMQWLNVIFDGMLHPATHFKFVPVKTEADAVSAVREKKADLGLIWTEHLETYKDDLVAGTGTLRVAFTSGRIPPSGLVAFGKVANSKDAKALVKALPEVCKGKANLDVCATLGFFYLKAGPEEYHPDIAYKYENYK
jgi:hypothetical protein